MVDVAAEFGKVVGQGFQPSLDVLAVLLSFAPGIYRDSAGRDEIDLSPVLCGWQFARRDGMPDDEMPNRAKHTVDKHGLSATESAVGFRHGKSYSGTTDFGRIAGELIRQQAQRTIPVQEIEEALKGGAGAVALETLDSFVRLNLYQLTTKDGLQESGVASLGLNRGIELKIPVVYFCTAGFEDARNIGVVLDGMLFESQQFATSSMWLILC